MDIRAMAQMEEHSLFSELSEEQINTSKMKAQVAVAIFKRRLELNMTQKEFAQHLGITQGMVSRLEAGECNMTLEKLNHICAQLNLSCTLDIRPKQYNWYNLAQRPQWNAEGLPGSFVLAKEGA